MKTNPPDTSLYDHVEELIKRSVRSLIVLILTSALAYHFIDAILSVVTEPVGKLVFTSPADAFVARVLLALIVGGFLALPFVLYEVWKFVAEGLKDHEKRHVLLYGPASLVLFFVGASFAYFIAVPITFKFLLNFSSEIMVPMITIKNYISFVGTLLISFGIVFELPLVLMFLAKIGIATPEFLQQKRRVAIVMIFVGSALITPPDLITLWIMAVPLIILYEVGIVVTKWTQAQEHKAIDLHEANHS